MFLDCSSLISLPDISKWNVENVKNIRLMFSSCSSLIFLPDLSKWNITKIKKKEELCSDSFLLINNYNINN